ncbi:MAG: hypothetical protein IKE75_04840 [Bacilli bacterium]|nr:hypothetical protein [Bacilli bacterium]
MNSVYMVGTITEILDMDKPSDNFIVILETKGQLGKECITSIIDYNSALKVLNCNDPPLVRIFGYLVYRDKYKTCVKSKTVTFL